MPLLPFACIFFYSAFHMLVIRNVVKDWSSKECHRGESTWSFPVLGSVVSYEWTYGVCEQVALKTSEISLRITPYAVCSTISARCMPVQELTIASRSDRDFC